MHSLNGAKNMKRFVVVRAEGYMTSRPASSVFVYTKTILRCKILVGKSQTLSNLHRPGAGCAMESLNSTKACWSPDVKKTAKQIKFTLPFYSNSTSSCNSNSVELYIANCCFNVSLLSCLAIKKAHLLNALR